MKSEMQINNKKKEIFGTVSIIGGFLLFIFGYLFYTISIDAMGEAFVTRAERMGLILIFPSLLFIGVGFHLRFKKIWITIISIISAVLINFIWFGIIYLTLGLVKGWP